MGVTKTSEYESVQLGETKHDGGSDRSPGTGRSRSKSIAARRATLIVPPLALALVLLLGWFTSTATGKVPDFILPPPSDVFATLVDGLRSGLFVRNAVVTIQES